MMRATFPTTIHLLFFRGEEILLLRRYNTGFRDGEYSVPAGHLDGGETVMQAGIREGKEEVGVNVKTDDLVFSSVMHRMDGEERVDFFVTVERWDGDIFNAEPERCDDLHWFRIDEMPDNTIPYIRRAIANHMSRVRFDEFGW